MFKWIIILILGISIWGGLTNAISFTSNDKNYLITIEKEKVIQAFKLGFEKVTMTIQNIDEVAKQNENENEIGIYIPTIEETSSKSVNEKELREIQQKIADYQKQLKELEKKLNK